MPHRIQSEPRDSRASTRDRQITQIASRVSAAIGTHFFRSMTEHLARVLEADCVYIGEFVGGQTERVQTLAAWHNHRPENFSFELAGSAAAPIALGDSCICKTRAQSHFPDDPQFSRWGAHACVGIPLMSSRKLPIGLIMTVYCKPLASTQAPKDILEVFASRAADELERRQQEEQLRNSEQRYRAFIADNADAMWRIEFEPPVSTALPEAQQLDAIYRDGYIAEGNLSLARQLGLDDPAKLIGAPLDSVSLLSNPTVRAATLHLIRAGYRFHTVETSPVGPDARLHFMLRTQWGIVEDGLLHRLWGSTRDITELKQAAIALDESEQRFAGLLQNLPLLVMIVSPAGEIEFWNDRLSHPIGWDTPDLAGKNWIDLMIPDADRARVRASVIATTAAPPRPVHFQSPVLGPSGDRRWVAWDSTSLRDSDGKTLSIAIVGCDITEFKALEARFHQTQKLEHIGRMTGGIAHDFNNLLTVVMGHAGVLLEKTHPSDPARDFIKQILAAAEKGAGLTQRLFTFSRHRVLRPEILNPTAMVADDLHMIRHLVGDRIQVVARLDSSPGFVHADSSQLHQIILNLVVNARDAMPSGGTLTLATSHTDPAYVELSVADTGTGMTEEVRSHLFEPFYTTKAEGQGTGLGLSMVYGIVQQSGGHIVVDTVHGAGTTIRILLPRVHSRTQALPPPATLAGAPGGTETILLIEDQADVRTLAAGILRDLGYAVLEAPSALAALQTAQDHIGDPVRLLLVGIALPDLALNQLTAALAPSVPAVRALFLSGQSDHPAPGQGSLEKPFTREALACAVRELLDRP